MFDGRAEAFRVLGMRGLEFPVAFGEEEVLFPVIAGDVVLAWAEVVADVFAHTLAGGGHFCGGEAGEAEEFIDC
ncbi:MAG: hypothetical protein RI897_1795 [Verrucomicrobiota bacterium]